MRSTRWATCARFAAAAIIAVSTLNDPATAQASPNPPKLQRKLEAAASAIKPTDYGVLRMTGATVGDHSLIIHSTPSPGVEPSAALARLNENKWEEDLCAPANLLQFIHEEGVKVVITFEPPGSPPVTVHEVTDRSCAAAVPTSASVSRMIGGVAFAPKPTREAAIALVQRYLKAHLLDPGSAMVECGQVSEAAWVKPILDPRRYGYFLKCSVNAKNLYGGYVGAQDMWFRMNGDGFEEFDDNLPKAGLMEQAK